jgi:adenylylsulfate kinase-like enzyme
MTHKFLSYWLTGLSGAGKTTLAKARQDSSFALTGLKAPYEPPTDADLCIDTSQLNLQDAVERVCSFKKL